MKTILIYVSLASCLYSLELISKHITVINNSPVKLFVQLKGKDNSIVQQTLESGDIIPVFSKSLQLSSITFGYANMTSNFSALANQTFKAKDYPINEANVFIINANNTLNMYQSSNSLHTAIAHQAKQYEQSKPLGSYSLQIEDEMNANGVIVQTVGHYTR